MSQGNSSRLCHCQRYSLPVVISFITIHRPTNIMTLFLQPIGGALIVELYNQTMWVQPVQIRVETIDIHVSDRHTGQQSILYVVGKSENEYQLRLGNNCNIVNNKIYRLQETILNFRLRPIQMHTDNNIMFAIASFTSQSRKHCGTVGCVLLS